MNPVRLSLRAERTSYRTEPPGTGEPEWSWEDFCHAAGASRCTEIETAALEYRWRQAGRCRHVLYGHLMVEALKAAKRHRWPERHEGHRFLDRMVQLALDVEANPRLDGLVPLVVPAGEDKKGKPKYQRFPGWWCLRLPWMSEEVWRKWGEPKYALVRQPLDIWAGEAVRKCRKVLQDE